MKILGYIIIVFLILGAIFGFLIALEYLRYFKRKIHLSLNSKLNKVTKDD